MKNYSTVMKLSKLMLYNVFKDIDR